MGVRGLWTVIEPTARPVLLETLRGKVLAIDASIWIFHFIKAMRDTKGSVLQAAHIIGFFRRICKLLFYEIKPVFIFDGAAPIAKKLTTARRQKRREGRQASARSTANKLLTLQLQRLQAEQRPKKTKAGPEKEAYVVGQIPENTSYLNEQRTPRKDDKFQPLDQYHLPDIDSIAPVKLNDQRLLTEEELDDYAREFTAQARAGFIETSVVDFKSLEFENLPMATKYQLLNTARLKSRLRMGYTSGQLNEMFPDKMEFSKFQIDRVSQRNFFTQKLMNIVGMEEDLTRRVSSEKNREYILQRNDKGWSLSLEDVPAVKKEEPESASQRPDDSDSEDLELEDVDLQPTKSPQAEPSERTVESFDGPGTESVPQPSTSKLSADTPSDKPQAGFDSFRFLSRGEDITDDLSFLFGFEDNIAREQLFGRQQVATEATDGNTNTKDDNKALEGNKPPWFTQSDQGFEPMQIVEETRDGERMPTKRSKDHWSTRTTVELAEPGTKKPKIVEPSGIKDIPGTRNVSGTRGGGGARVVTDPPDVSNTRDISDTRDVTTRDIRRPSISPQDMNPRDVGPQDVHSITDDLDAVRDIEMSTNRPVEPSSQLGYGDPVATSGPESSFNATDRPISNLEQTDVASPLPDSEQSTRAEQAVGDLGEADSVRSSDGVDTESPVVLQNVTANLPENEPKDSQSHEVKQGQPEIDIGAGKIDGGEVGMVDAEVKAEEPPLSETDRNFADADAAAEQEENQDLVDMLIDEAEENDRFTRALAHDRVQHNLGELGQEIQRLKDQFGKESRDADTVSDEMVQDCQELLQFFGIPYLTAPAEAEAQCAELQKLGLVDGIVTDDGDSFLFGDVVVYRNMFSQAKFVETYKSETIERELGLNREKLISLALLLGSDYTDGILGIGPVTGVEILADFGDLKTFKAWWEHAQRFPDEAELTTGFKKRFLKQFKSKLFLGDEFPDVVIEDAYRKPVVDSDESPFQWGAPDLDGLRNFLMRVAHWSHEDTDRVLLPVVQEAKRKDLLRKGTQSQSSLDGYVQVTRDLNLGSARAKKATGKLRQQREKK